VIRRVLDYTYDAPFWTSGRYNHRNKQWTWTGSGRPVQNINFVNWEDPKKDAQMEYVIKIAAGSIPETGYGHGWFSFSVAILQNWTSPYICEKAIDPTLFPK
jgi:hypothetical protein